LDETTFQAAGNCHDAFSHIRTLTSSSDAFLFLFLFKTPLSGTLGSILCLRFLSRVREISPICFLAKHKHGDTFGTDGPMTNLWIYKRGPICLTVMGFGHMCYSARYQGGLSPGRSVISVARVSAWNLSLLLARSLVRLAPPPPFYPSPLLSPARPALWSVRNNRDVILSVL